LQMELNEQQMLREMKYHLNKKLIAEKQALQMELDDCQEAYDLLREQNRQKRTQYCLEIDALQAELEARNERRCETCKYDHKGSWRCEQSVRRPYNKAGFLPEARATFGCSEWEARDD